MSTATFSEQDSATTSVTIAPELSEKLSDPRTAAQLSQLLDQLGLINILVGGLGGMAARSDTIIQSVGVAAGQARDTVNATASEGGVDGGFDVGASVGAATKLIAALPGFTPALLRGGESGALDALTSDEMVSFLRMSTTSLDDAFDGKDVVEINGIRSLNKALHDADIQRALSFVMTVAKGIGKQLAEPHEATKPTKAA